MAAARPGSARLVRRPFAGVIAALAAFACGPPLEVRYEEEVRAASPPARHAIHSERLDEARAAIRWYQDTFGPQHFYLELQRHVAQPELEGINQGLVALGRELGVGLVATNDVPSKDVLKKVREGVLSMITILPRIIPLDIEALNVEEKLMNLFRVAA